MRMKNRRGSKNHIKLCLGVCTSMILCLMSGSNVTAAPSNGGADAEDFHVLEILPHESASVFSYLVGGLEASTPIGKEGLETLLGMEQGKDMFSAPDAKFDDTRPFTKLVDYYQENSLAKYLTGDKKNYSDLVVPGTDAKNRGKKWHIAKTGEMLTGQNGYFEYVGDHGLYQISNVGSQITTEYEYIKDGSYGIWHIVSFSSRAENGGSGEVKTNYDFEVVFSNDPAGFEKIQTAGAYQFANESSAGNRYRVLSAKINQDSGKYYLKNVGGKDIYVYAPDRDQLADADTLDFYDVWFQKDDSGNGTYYIEEIKPAAKKGEGEYCIRAWQDIFVSIGNGKGVAERYISEIDKGAVSCEDGADALKNQKWIWVPVSSENMPKSKYTNLTSPVMGTRIYVKNMTLPKACYAKDGYKNNEWGKLLMLEWDGYDKSKPAQTNVEKAREEGVLAAYNMQVTSKRPSQITMADLERADLIYIASESGFSSIRNYWKDLTGRDETIKDDFAGEDLSFAQVQYIYEQYYKRQKAIIFQVDIPQKTAKNSNLYKLFMMFGYFEEPDVFAKFFDSLERPKTSFTLQGRENVKGNYTQIHRDGGLTIGTYSSDSYKNIQCPIAEGVSWAGSGEISAGSEWNINYFTPRALDGVGNNPYTGYKPREGTYNGAINQYTGKNYMFTDYWGANFVSNININFDIYQMLNFIVKPKIVFMNADEVKGKDYIYVEDFENRFYIDYRAYSKKKQIKQIDVVLEAVGANYVGTGVFEATPVYTKSFASPVKEHEENHVSGTNNGLKFQKNSIGYSNGTAVFFPKNLRTGMQRKAKVIVTYDADGTGNLATIEKEITVVARDSFDLN